MAISHSRFINLTPEEIGKMSKSQVVELLEDVRNKLAVRLKTFSKQGKYFYSPAERIINEYYQENPPVNINEISRNRALNEVFSIQSFFQAKTGSLKGARDVMREQDIRIYGESKVNPKLAAHKLTKDQRDAYWSVYNEFINQKKNAVTRFTSDAIMQYLGELTLAKEGRNLEYEDPSFFDAVYKALEGKKITVDATVDLPNVLIASNRGAGDASKVSTRKRSFGKR